MGRTSDAGQRLIAAMARLVHRRGYAAVGVDEICREAGVKKGSFYYYFESKRDLMRAALKHQWKQNLEPMMRMAFDPGRAPLERFAFMIEGMAQVESANQAAEGHVLGCPFGKVAAELSYEEPALARETDAAFCRAAALYEATLVEAQKAGQLPRGVNAKDAAEAIMAYMQGIMLLARTRNDPTVIRRLGGMALQLALEPAPAAKRPKKTRKS